MAVRSLLARLSTMLLTLASAARFAPAMEAGDYFAIEVVDESTGRGVPLVELETVNNIRYVTDSAGWIAFDEPGLMGRKVFFKVRSHGYEFAKDQFGFAGVALETVRGKSGQLRIKRLNIAERMYRVTGAGIYRDSVMLGKSSPIQQPLLNAEIVGLDSVQSVAHGGKIFWFWGDTNRPGYPLGNFHTTAATSQLPGQGGLDPAAGVDLSFLTGADGFAKKMMPMPEDRPGPIWTDGVFTVTDEHGDERIVANFVRVKTIDEFVERGIMILDEASQQFSKAVDIPLDEPLGPHGQAMEQKVVVDGQPYQYFGVWGPPNIRVRADWKSILDLTQYEAYTPLAAGAQFDGKNTKLDRVDGGLRWGWKRNTAPLTNREQKTLIDAGLMKPEESQRFIVDVATGKPVTLHSATVAYNNYRKRYVMIGLEVNGASPLGEVWYAEAEMPEGPWHWAIKVVTHDKYSFYNPRMHALFEQAEGRLIYFEGTYANSISGADVQTPRYDYNQVMYRLDLADDRLKALRDKQTE